MARSKNKSSTPLNTRPGSKPVTATTAITPSQTTTQTPNEILPSPEILARYKEILPDAPERIIRVFEEDSKFARIMDQRALEAQYQENRRNQYMAWSLVFIGIASATLLAYLGKDLTAAIIAGATLVGLILGFIVNRTTQQ